MKDKPFLFILILLLGVLLLTGCTKQEGYCHIQGDGLRLSVDDATEPVKLEILGNENVIHVNPGVSLKEVMVQWGYKNNTIYLYGSPIDDGTSSYEPHNCTLTLDESNNIEYYQD